jgi:uncharacterized membrane protein
VSDGAAAFEWTVFAGRLHPLLLHLPIGLFAGVVVLEGLALVPGEQRRGVTFARRLLALVGAGAALVAALSGWWLADEGGYDAELVDDHRWMAIGFAVVFALAALLERRDAPPRRELARRAALVLAGALVAVAGHHGGMLSHGTTFLSSKAPAWLAPFVGHEAEAAAPVALVADAQGSLGGRAFAALARRCIECHGPDQQKGGLRLDLAADLATVLVPGDAPASELMRRVMLPASHPDFMPTEGEPLTDAEVLALRDWINAGAPFEELETARAVEAAAAAVAAQSLADVAAQSGAVLVPVDPAAPQGAMRADYGRGDGVVGADELRALAALAPRLSELSLAGRDLAPDAAAALPDLAALRVLRLERTRVGGAPLGDADAARLVQRTPNVEKLVVHSTGVGDDWLQRLGALPTLAELYVADTRLSPAALARFAAARPALRLVGAAVGLDDPLVGGPRHVLAADASRGRLAFVRELVDDHETVWEREIEFLHDLALLPSGHVLYQETATRIVEWDPATDRVVFAYDAAVANRANGDGSIEVHSFGRLPDGTTFVAESGARRIAIVDEDGRLVHAIPLVVERPDPHRDTRLVRPTPSGTFLVAHEGDGVVREYARDGRVVWSFDVPLEREPAPGHGPDAYGDQVFGAQRLPNGNTLVATGNGHSVLEVAPDGAIVWRLDQDDLPGVRLAWVTTVQVLENGNLVVANCHGGEDSPQLLEVTREREVVWSFELRELFGDALTNAFVVEDGNPDNRPPASGASAR